MSIATLGYVAATAARGAAEEDLLQEALERAARAVRAELRKVEPDSLDATFDLASEGPDALVESRRTSPRSSRPSWTCAS